MIDIHSWGFWRRVLLFIAGVLGLASQMLSVTAQQVQWLTFGVAVVNLALSLLPDDVAVRAIPGVRTK